MCRVVNTYLVRIIIDNRKKKKKTLQLSVIIVVVAIVPMSLLSATKNGVIRTRNVGVCVRRWSSSGG